MNINFNAYDKTIFDEIPSGECFIFGGEVYLKFQENWDLGNAVCLSNGVTSNFANDASVESVCATVTISRWE